MKLKFLSITLLLIFFLYPVLAQLPVGMVSSNVNFREGPGTNYKIIHSISSSELLIILPREPVHGFVEAFDVETSSRGYVYGPLVKITDSLFYQEQHFFEKLGENQSGDVEISMINRTDYTLYVWINKISYNISPREKKNILLEDEDVTYFSSAPGLFPVFGKETLKKGETYIWNFSL